MKEASTVARTKLGDTKKGEGIDAVFKVCEEEPEWVVEAFGKVVLSIFFLRYGLILLRLVLKIAFIWPIKIFFWPFFLFRGERNKKANEMHEGDERSKNKEDGSSKMPPGKPE